MEYALAIQKARDYLAAHEDRILQGLQEFLRIASISTLPAHAQDMERAATYLASRLRELGFPVVKVIPTAGHPLVFADSGPPADNPTALTVMIYGHYDVQPVDPLDQWETPPFEPVIRDDRIYARGASDDKGPVWMHLAALEALRAAVGRLPLRFKLLIEGEEEISSPHLYTYLLEARGELDCDVVVISDTAMYAPGIPSICSGLRGIFAGQIDIIGPAHDLHSGVYGGVVANPIHVLAELLASFHDADGRVNIPGFYDSVRPLSPSEREAWARLPFSETAFCEEIGVPALTGEKGFSPLERMWGRPTLEVNGIWGGFQGEGTKTIIPATAHAKITCRLVPDQDPAKIARLIEEAIASRLPRTVRYRFTVMEGGHPWTTSPEHPYMKAAAAALQECFGAAPVFIRMGGSIPIVSALARQLGKPIVLLGFSLPNERIHAPNEHFHLANMRCGMQALVAYWLRLAAGPVSAE
ncbi:MAG: dipeptidase [Limnochordales bacterium]|nr:dipeptidase [Limnochordales bacterium]